MDVNEVLYTIELTREEIELLLGAVANLVPKDKDSEKKLFDLYVKFRRKLYPDK